MFSSNFNLKENSFQIPLKFNAAFETKNLSENAMFSFNFVSGTTSSINLHGVISNLFNSEGLFNEPLQTAIRGDLNLKNFSPFMLRSLILFDAKSQDQLSAVFGDHFDAEGHFDIHDGSGPVSISVKGNNGNLDFKGQVAAAE